MPIMPITFPLRIIVGRNEQISRLFVISMLVLLRRQMVLCGHHAGAGGGNPEGGRYGGLLPGPGLAETRDVLPVALHQDGRWVSSVCYRDSKKAEAMARPGMASQFTTPTTLSRVLVHKSEGGLYSSQTAMLPLILPTQKAD